MSILTGFYELSLWHDMLQTDGSYKEQRLMVIGSNEMESQAKICEPRLTVNVNGSHNLNFKMYYRYIDNITGESIENPFVPYIANESKLKLYHKNKWYDFIVKSISENSADYSFTYSAVDYHINELSKNGFGLTLDTELENNVGTVLELGQRIMEDTGWTVESESIPQTLEEALVEIVFNEDTEFSSDKYPVIKLLDSGDNGLVEQKITKKVFKKNEKIYLFYSCLKEENRRLQFIQGWDLKTDQNRVITTKDCQFCIDNVVYTVDVNYEKLGLFKPALPFMENTELVAISEQYRGNRYVFSLKTVYNPTLDKYVTEYKKGSQTWHCFTETKYEAPIMVQNLITNSTFENTLGWTGTYASPVSGETVTQPNKQKDYGATVTADTTPNSLFDDIRNGNYNSNKTYTPCLKISTPEIENGVIPIVVNSGIWDNRKNIGNLSPGQEFALLINADGLINNNGGKLKASKIFIGSMDYYTKENCYSTSLTSYIDFTISSDTVKSASQLGDKYKDYYYIKGIVSNNYNLTETQFLGTKLHLFFQFSGAGTCIIKDIMLIPYIPKGNLFMVPEDVAEENTIAIKEYCYFDPNSTINKNATSQSGMYIIRRTSPMEGLDNSYASGATKIVTLSVKQSNYFNAIHSLCETAECWADFIIDREEDGSIKSKKIKFRRYIGQDNYVGFRYGVNLKQITRQVNSNSIVTKLIVPDNTNEYANNGFCTIARAGSNETGEGYIYDFSYYINNGMIPRNEFVAMLYNLNDAKGVDVGSTWSKEDTNHYGYYVRLSRINKKLDEVTNTIATYSIPLMEAKANLTTASNGYTAAEEEYRLAAADFYKLAGFEYNAADKSDEQKEFIKNNQDAVSYLQAIITHSQSLANFEVQRTQAQAAVTAYENENARLIELRDELREQKELLNLAFYKNYSRFIQEGTWKDDAEIDDEKYFINARSVAYTSSKPQVSYSINVMELEGLPEYENIKFELADKTWIEDTEFFGYDESGNPIREEIVLTEIVYNLDDPSATTVKVQNYKNQFQDLFQRITAQVQSVSYSSGAWENAATFVQADPNKQSQFLQDALNSAELVIKNGGNQSVESGEAGIVVTDLSKPSQQIKITGGAILLSDTDAGGNQIWKVGMTARGINAQTINAGSINTDNIQIMGGSEPYFRWDKYGITAYNHSEDSGKITYDTKKGVRFDRFGLYGFSGKDGASWHPEDLNDIRNNSLFSLTWDGLFIKLGSGTYYYKNGDKTESKVHSSQTLIGKVDDNIYNAWEGGIPVYKLSGGGREFVKVLSIGVPTTGGGTTKINEELVIYDDGTLSANKIKLTGSIEWTEASSPSKNVYATSAYVNQEKYESIKDALPENGKTYGEFPSSDSATYTGWHQISSPSDSYYAHTDDGGATWQGPFLITGKSILNTEVKYGVFPAGTSTDSDIVKNYDKWSDTRPVLSSMGFGQQIYIRSRDHFNDDTYSDPRYDVGAVRSATINLTRDAASIPASVDGTVDEDLLKTLSTVAVELHDGTQMVPTPIEKLEYKWTVTGGTIQKAKTNEQGKLVDENSKPTFSTISAVYMNSFTADSATITVEVQYNDSMNLGTKTFTISKSFQGEDAVMCYIESSEGMAFEEQEKGTTTLTAYVIRGGEEVDGLKYDWYYEEGEIDTLLEDDSGITLSGKTITISKSRLVGKRIYFIASSVNS